MTLSDGRTYSYRKKLYHVNVELKLFNIAILR